MNGWTPDKKKVQEVEFYNNYTGLFDSFMQKAGNIAQKDEIW